MPWISHNAGESGIGLQEEDGHPTKAGCPGPGRLIRSPIGCYLHDGKHDVTREDWQATLELAVTLLAGSGSRECELPLVDPGTLLKRGLLSSLVRKSLSLRPASIIKILFCTTPPFLLGLVCFL